MVDKIEYDIKTVQEIKNSAKCDKRMKCQASVSIINGYVYDFPWDIEKHQKDFCDNEEGFLKCPYHKTGRIPYPDDFEMAVLSAVNGGGNNMARAALTGALSGAMVGSSRIPERFISGLKDSERLLKFAEKVTSQALA